MDYLPVWVPLVVAAPFIGSFLGVLIVRLPERKPIVFDVSRCDACGRILRAHELVPFASFALQRGRCRDCGARIDPIHLAAEIGALAIVAWAATVTGGWVLGASCLLGWFLLVLALIDLRTGLLPDALTLPLAVAGLIVSALLFRQSALDHVIGAAAGFLAFALLAALYRVVRGHDGMGLGDAKLLGAIGAWVEWRGLPTVILFAAIGGLALAVLQHGSGRLSGRSRIAFGAPLALAGWLVWLYGPLIA